MIHVIVGNKMATTEGDATQTFIQADSLEEMKEKALRAAYEVLGNRRAVILLDGYREHRRFDVETGHLSDDTVHEARALIYLEG